MEKILEVDNLRKTYSDSAFGLKGVNLSIPYGSIVGFIGENGAGKSTTMSSILGLLKKDSGTIKIFEEEMDTDKLHMKEDIGVVFDSIHLPATLTIKKLEGVFQHTFDRWNTDTFYSYIDFFALPKSKKISEFSRGMSMKLSVAVALSHDAKLLILDEATAGLDAGGRSDMLSVLEEFVRDKRRGVLLSSHITSDIETIADTLVFIKQGEILWEVSKQDLLNNFAVIQCDVSQYENLKKRDIVAYQKKGNLLDVLISNQKGLPPFLTAKKFSIDDITLILMRGEIV
ncbi:ABC transporter ATP-binding protein [Halalkalibacillus halophilus]|uniref:ABC transporter ATP-binding protein n=1 Tax=Halalkalibacillus halophilus TaxID=392827 RepID=UPI000415E6B8|nr:ABC transporter ATP-binding protein [Halalkalibacillus halophilus]